MSKVEKSNVRVRFAPSPTGYLHVGGARTALFCYLFAKSQGGEFILRIEDTDQERSTEEALRMQVSDLKWLGLDWDEGVNPETLEDMGPHGPYRQSQRGQLYKEATDRLLQEGKAYYCFMKDAEMDEQRQSALAAGEQPHVKSPYRNMPLDEAKQKVDDGEPAVIRFKLPAEAKEYKINDLVRGEVSFSTDMISDFVLLRSNGMPVYNFCCVVDDANMQITHVLRAEEHLSNTLRQLILYEALALPVPEFAHMSLILGEDKQKLSKRHGATSVHEYAERGFLPEGLKNFLALLGWSSPEGKEVMSESEILSQFSLDRLNPAPAVFDETKLTWMNSMHLRELPHSDLWKRIEPKLKAAGIQLPTQPEWRERAIGLMKTYMETLNDAVALFAPLSLTGFAVSEDGRETMSWENSQKVVQTWLALVQENGDSALSEEDFSKIQNQVKTDCGVKGKDLFMPIRVAVIGKPHGADLKTLVPLMEPKELVRRGQEALKSV